MKITKSRACLMAYIISLFIVVLLSFLVDNAQLSRIAFSATVAGLIFAISDYYSFSADEIKVSYSNDEKFLNSYSEISTKLKRSISDTKNAVTKYVEICENKGIDKTESSAFMCEIETLETAIEEIDNNVVEICKECMQKEKTMTKKEEKSNWLLCLGFGVAIIIVFLELDFVNNFYMSNVTTILSFALITLTYFLKDLAEDKRKKDKDILEKYEIMFKTFNGQLVESEKRLQNINKIIKKFELE